MNINPHGGTPTLTAGVPLEQSTLCVILLHGRGGSAQDILGLAHAFDLPGVAYLAPQAANHTWYPQSFLAPREANQPFLNSALDRIASLVASLEQAGVSRRRVVLGGFSQGACLATEFVATHPGRYAGLIAYTGGLIGPEGTVSAKADPGSATLDRMPALLASGDPDPHVPWQRVELSAQKLRAMGADVTLRRYPNRPHTVSQPELQLGRDLLRGAIDDISSHRP